MISIRPHALALALALASPLAAQGCTPTQAPSAPAPASTLAATPASASASDPASSGSAASRWAPVPPEPARQRPGLPEGVISLTIPEVKGVRNSIHSLSADATRVFFSDSAGRIWGARKDGKEKPYEVLAGAGPTRPNPLDGVFAFTHTPVGDELFFAANQGLMAIDKAGGEPRLLRPGAPVLVVSGGSDLFLTSSRPEPLLRLGKDGGNARPLGPAHNIAAVGVDDRHVFMIDRTTSALLRVPRDGGPGATLASGLPSPVGLALDATHVYVSCEKDGSIRRVARGGGAVQKLTADPQNNEAIAVDGEYLYWTTFHAGNGQLLRMSKDGKGPAERLLSGLISPSGLIRDGRRLVLTHRDPDEVLVVDKDVKDKPIPRPTRTNDGEVDLDADGLSRRGRPPRPRRGSGSRRRARA